jgi:dTDP-4-dehydrorhamnose 3,5-epimerase
MHFHERQDDLWIVIDGRAFVAAVDLRDALGPGGGETVTEAFELDPGDAVYIPKGVAHGFYAIEPLALVYLVTTEYDATDEHGFAWNDPRAAIPWPSAAPVVSDRDRSNPALAAVIDAARQRGHSVGR